MFEEQVGPIYYSGRVGQFEKTIIVGLSSIIPNPCYFWYAPI